MYPSLEATRVQDLVPVEGPRRRHPQDDSELELEEKVLPTEAMLGSCMPSFTQDLQISAQESLASSKVRKRAASTGAENSPHFHCLQMVYIPST